MSETPAPYGDQQEHVYLMATDAAAIIGVNVTTIYRWCAAGKIVGARQEQVPLRNGLIRNEWRIPEGEVVRIYNGRQYALHLKEVAAWRKKYPNACETCHGIGLMEYNPGVPLCYRGEQPIYEVEMVPCEDCVEKNRCPRCASPLAYDPEWGVSPCPSCGWRPDKDIEEQEHAPWPYEGAPETDENEED